MARASPSLGALSELNNRMGKVSDRLPALAHPPSWSGMTEPPPRAWCRVWPELTKRPSGTHKLRQGLSENLSTRVSAQSANPTGISVEAGPQLSNPIRHRFGVYGKRVISDTLINTAATCGPRAID